MSANWTDEQLRAIETGGSNLLVSAAAGAGKTAVLVERIIRKITDPVNPVDVDRLLVVTFTKAAASEMRERIGIALARELGKNPDSEHLNRQLTLLNRASITTLHSFCLEIMRQYFYRIDLDPSFRVADATEAALMRMETLEDLFEENYGSGDQGFLNLVDALGGERDDSALQEMVLRLYNFAWSHPWPREWLNTVTGNYKGGEGGPPDALLWGRTLMGWVIFMLHGCRTKVLRALKLATAPGGPEVYAQNLREDLTKLDDVINAASISWEEVYRAINSFGFNKLKTCRDKDVDESLRQRVKKTRDTVKKSVNDLREALFSRAPQELVADLQLAAPLVDTLAALVADFEDRYHLAKSAKGLVDFSDLEHCCLQILLDETASPETLVPSSAAYEIREHFEEVLVDEYQDINGVQETILQLISREGSPRPNRFMVGDVKQSIYRFRLADPKLFMAKYRDYPRISGGPDLAVDLTRNFRSRREIIDAVNFIFRQVMTAGVGEIPYDSKAELVCGSEYPAACGEIATAEGPAEIYLLEKNPADVVVNPDDYSGDPDDSPGEPPDDIEDLDAVQWEARLTARRIREMVSGTPDRPGPEFCVFDRKTGNFRPVQFRDIVVLLRATKNTANTFMEEFRLSGVPAYADLDTGYFEAVEVETMMSLLRVIDNPRQDIPLAAVLRSPLVGLDAGELARVRLTDQRADFYDAVKKSAQAGEAQVDLKLRAFLNRLEEWRTLARSGNLSQLIWRLYNETGYYAYVGGMPGGAQRQANLRALYDRARQYESTTFRGLFRFLRFVEKFQESGSDLGAARSMGENEDVVRIVSIHKSKGLEFPVVIAAGLGKQFNTADIRQKIQLHKELGLGLPVVDLNLCLSYPTIAQVAIARRLQMEMLAEEMRILYVALTRAKEKLILIGSVRNLEKEAARWCEAVDHDGWALPETDLAGAKSFLDWICPAVARHSGGYVLRKLAGVAAAQDGPVVSDSSAWQVYITARETLKSPEPEVAGDSTELLDTVRAFLPVNIEEEYSDYLDLCLNWQYPYPDIVTKPAKATVSELKRRFDQEAAEELAYNDYAVKAAQASSPFVRPRFLQRSGGISPAEYGSLMHLVMQHLDPAGDVSEKGVAAKVRELVINETLTEQQAEAVNISAAATFFHSSLGQRVMAAREVKKEVPFTMVLPAAAVYGPEPAGAVEQIAADTVGENSREQVLVQGVIDLLLDEGDGYVIVDYKTDRVPPGGPAEIAHRYKSQLALYAVAVSKILQKPVKGKYLYLFDTAQEVECG